ncbi:MULTISPECIES: RNA polymerase sigma factor [Mesobacillus]|uniref:RNA polymerase sigma factor n=1 Tax=Mesobacillus TaxID=2675231 RepID=UPI00177F1295|nr:MULTISPECIES: RNA polymerase sigma factor [Mesobacillus]MCM3572397.1 RNA polymerase sigma factor [Mesobacillus subterraneus]UYZ23913.1 RNA polymerase sigma factor [Mesobacillus jeotgali]
MNKEQELIVRIRGGDHEAFSILVKPLLSSAYKTAYIILRSKEHTEDALQIALEGAYVSIMKKKDITNFKAWFYRLVYSRSIDIYRKNNRLAYIDFDDNREAQLKITSESAQQIAIHKESKSEMIRHLMKLKREQSLPIFLYYYEDMSVKEISLILNENINTVKARMKRGKQSLAKILQESRQFVQEVKVNGI